MPFRWLDERFQDFTNHTPIGRWFVTVFGFVAIGTIVWAMGEVAEWKWAEPRWLGFVTFLVLFLVWNVWLGIQVRRIVREVDALTREPSESEQDDKTSE